MAKKQRLVDDAVANIIRGGGRPFKQDKPHPLAVALGPEEVERLATIAEELGVTRHALLQYAARQFLADWERGRRPIVSEKRTVTLEATDQD
jgi:hypothetical protein